MTELATLLVRFESELDDWIHSFAVASPTAEMVRYHLGYESPQPRRGKRLRPRMLLCTALEECETTTNNESKWTDAIRAAVAVELLHNYSLVHDDIEDGDEVRHGRPTVWKRFGSAHGINAGDAMGAIAHLALLAPRRIQDPQRAAALAHILQEANLRMCWGQGLDLAFEQAHFVTHDEYIRMVDGKTAALFAASCALGASAVGAAGDRCDAYAEAGRQYGRAFQMRDDLLGIWGESQTTGKPSGADLKRRKWSYPIVWALGTEASVLQERIIAAYHLPAPLPDELVVDLIETLETLGARQATDMAVRKAVAEAEAILHRHALDRTGTLHTLLTENIDRLA